APLVEAAAALPGQAEQAAALDGRALLLGIVGLVEAARAGIATPADLRRTAERTVALALAGVLAG
ncbi:MAG TPA: hypothetical protein PKA95_12250, partial [Thermomicrobiales bacterium]|nr:hypothetical protein [Thermomicrobiales bacterium]